MTDLVTTQRAGQSSALATLASGSSVNQALLSSLISAASAAIRQFTGRDFTQTTYVEFHNGDIYHRVPVPLRQFPATGITSISIANSAMLIRNNGSTAQKAMVQTLSNGDIKLTSTASGIVTTTNIAAATYLTIGSVATYINALGSGWSAAVYSGSAGSYGLFPTTDLKTLQGAVSAMVGGAYLDIYEDWSGFGNCAWWPEWGDCGITGGWRLDDATGELYGHFPRGQQNIRVTYVAGYANIPADVQEATVAMVQSLYQQSLTNSALESAKLGDAAVTFANRKGIPREVTQLLAPYVDHARVISR